MRSTIIKIRGTKHSIKCASSSERPRRHAADVYASGGEVLHGCSPLGTGDGGSRRRKEAARLALDIRRKRQELAEIRVRGASRNAQSRA